MQKNTLKFMPVSDVCDSKSVQKISLFSFFLFNTNDRNWTMVWGLG